MRSLWNRVFLQKLQELTVRRSVLEVENAIAGQQLRERRKKGREIGLAGDLPERATHVETNAPHFIPGNGTEDFGEQAHAVIWPDSIMLETWVTR
jgi:hypothetical protein